MKSNVVELEEKLHELELERMFSGPYDSNDAIISIQSGAGGLESQDWANRLLRMYVRWAESKKLKVEELSLHGEGAGIKSVSLKISGKFAYGLLRSEKGVHRFMRVSPYDANKKRQTSFVRVDLVPVFEYVSGIKINKSDIETTNFRASGPGGQHRNKVETAVRIRHIPSGIVVERSNSKSQSNNKENAMAELKSRLIYQAELENKKKMEDLAGDKSDVSFGHQIRTYIVHSRQVVVDERTNKEYRPVEDILDGDLDDLIFDYLKLRKKKMFEALA